jgi:predicted small metal-binding protein
MKQEVGGHTISQELLNELKQDLSINLMKNIEEDVINNIKETLCHIALDYAEEEEKYNET